MSQDEPRDAARVLRAQVTAALRELVRGLAVGRPAPDRSGCSATSPNPAFEARDDGEGARLVAALMRVVFVLFAEAHGLVPARPLARLRDALALDARDAWARVVAVTAALGFDGGVDGLAPSIHVSNEAACAALEALLGADGPDWAALEVEHLGAAYEGLVGLVVRRRSGARGGDEDAARDFVLEETEARRRSGAHYTARPVTVTVVERALAPLLHAESAPHDILRLAVCDPAMGSGAFLVEACRQLARTLVEAWERSGTTPLAPGDGVVLHARRLVARRCLYGVDLNPLAVELARLSLWLLAAAPEHPSRFLAHALRHGDALLGLAREATANGQGHEALAHREAMLAALDRGAPAEAAEHLARADAALAPVRAARDLTLATSLGADLRARHAPFHWEIELPEVFARAGFDAVVGNPPWVSYAGRAAQPLAHELRAFYAATSPAFFGYRNLQGVFVHRAATLLRPGGRLGLVLPTSMSDLGGYEPSRRAHDELCACDDPLPDFGDGGFEGVFQPCMALLSTRRPAPLAIEATSPWPLERKDLDADAARWLAALSALPRLPPHLFGERGFQTTGEDVRRLRDLAAPEGSFTTPLRVGGDIAPCLRRPARLYADPAALEGRLRPAAAYEAVKLLLRQTARYPMAALSDGQAFRNSILAGFADAEHDEHLLLVYLNASPVRWYHYMRHRDARQGMPQLKIAHLRALPAPPRRADTLGALERIGRVVGVRNTGITGEEQAAIDALVADALGVPAEARARIAAWARTVRG